MPMRRPFVLLLTVLTACGGATPTQRPHRPRVATTTTSTIAPSTSGPASTTTAAPPSVLTIRYRVERQTTDDATADFVDVVKATLADPRGWTRARFEFVPDASAPYLIVLAEGDEVDRLCLPYDTY